MQQINECSLIIMLFHYIFVCVYKIQKVVNIHFLVSNYFLFSWEFISLGYTILQCYSFNMNPPFLSKVIYWWSSPFTLFAACCSLNLLSFVPYTFPPLPPFSCPASSFFSAYPNTASFLVPTSNPVLSDFCFEPQCSTCPLSLQ